MSNYESRKVSLSATEWYQVTTSETENYLLQATGDTFFVLVSLSPTEPTDEEDVHILTYMDSLNHMILKGIIWAKGKQGNTSITLSKKWE